MPEDLASQGILRFTEGGRRLMAQGQFVDLARKYEPALWYGTLPAPAKGPLYGASVDDTGRAACGPVVRSVTPAQSAAGEVKPASPAPPPPTRSPAWGIPAEITASAACVGCAMLMTRRRRPTVAAFGAAMIGVAWLVVLGHMCATLTPSHEASLGFPVDSSIAVYLFLDRSEAAPHRIHVLSFVEAVTPQTILNAQRERFQVAEIPAVVLDARTLIGVANAMAAPGTLDRCLAKPPARLSMEMHGGGAAGRELSLGFLMGNHDVDHEVGGSTTMFACESGVEMDGWSCDRAVRDEVAEGRPIGSICTEKPCTRLRNLRLTSLP